MSGGRRQAWQVVRWSRRRSLTLGAGAVAFLAACGGDGKQDESNPGSASGSGAPATQAAAEQPRSGGIISQRLQTDPPSMDIHQVTTYSGVWPFAPCFNQLVQFDPNKSTNTEKDVISD